VDERTLATEKPATAARIYDVHLGGTHNYPADREAARQVVAFAPRTPAIARANRAFLRRAVRHLAESGIRQFLDIGAGIPTEGNVHEIAQEIAPEAHVVYVDIDPVAVAEGMEILQGNPYAASIGGDARDTPAILAHSVVRELIDFSQPVAVLFCAVLHFVTDDSAARRAVDTAREVMAPGSYLVISHATADGTPPAAAPGEGATETSQTDAVQAVYAKQTASTFRLRGRAELESLFDGFELIDPGLVWVPQWRPDPSDRDEFTNEPELSVGYAGVGRLNG
jgi:hypothetical protein